MSDPTAPGEIGWPANFTAPGDASKIGVATAAPFIKEGRLVAADGSELDSVTPAVEPEPTEVVEAEVEPEVESEATVDDAQAVAAAAVAAAAEAAAAEAAAAAEVVTEPSEEEKAEQEAAARAARRAHPGV